MCWFTPQKPTKCGLGPGAKVGVENAIQIFSVGCGNPVAWSRHFGIAAKMPARIPHHLGLVPAFVH